MPISELKLAKELIRRPSVTPKDAGAINILAKNLRSLGFKCQLINFKNIKNLYAKLGKLSPITGGFLTEKSAFYIYTGAQAEYDFGIFKITPSFAPGYYNSGGGKDLGSALEFKSEIQLSLNLSDSTEFGMSYNHISNASLGDKNPGANSYMFNFLKQF